MPPPPPPPRSSLLWLWILLGVLGVVFVAGVLAAIAIPAFTDYSKRARRTEAELNLNAIEKATERKFAEQAGFPTGSAGPTPPLGTCCAGPGHKCAVDERQWDPPAVWDQLDFMQFQPHSFSYSYEGTADGQRFTAKAYGDLDCDGDYVEYTLTGTVVDGRPRYELTKPARPD